MPKIEDLQTSKKKIFKKREYRPYNPEGESLEQELVVNQDPISIVSHHKDMVIEIDPYVIKNWEFHEDSVHSLYVTEGFNRFLTGGKNGEIFMTDLSRGCYCKIDMVNEPITSLAMNSNMEIIASTADNKIYEYVSKI